MSTSNIDAHNLSQVAVGGVVREDVLDQIFQIDIIPLPFTMRIGRDDVDRKYTEWTIDELEAISITNNNVDGADASGNDATVANNSRVGNHCQILDKVVRVSVRADASNTIGRARESVYQLNRRQQALRQDMEATMLSSNNSVSGTDAVAGELGGLAAWIEMQTDRDPALAVGAEGYRGATTGADGGFNTGTSVVDSPTAGTVRGLSEKMIRDAGQSVYNNGGMPSVLMSRPTVIRNLSEYMFTSSARIATMTGNTSVDSGTGSLTAKGSANVFVTDFGVVLEMVPNRIQQEEATDNDNVFIIDPSMVRMGVLRGMQAERLAKNGLAENWQISIDMTLKVLNQKSHAVIADINDAIAVDAGS